MDEMIPKVTMTEVTDPEELAASRARRERFERNAAWLEAHHQEVYSHRGKYYCIAGQELFIGGDIKEVLARARSAHPEDDGPCFGYIRPTRATRIYANRRQVVPLR